MIRIVDPRNDPDDLAAVTLRVEQIIEQGMAVRCLFDKNLVGLPLLNQSFHPLPESGIPHRVEEYSLRPDSGGAGKYRGGLGQSRTLRALQPISMNQMSNRHRLPAWGLESGKEGKTGATLFLLNGSARWQDAREAYGRASSSKYSNIKLVAGDTVKVLMPGGGGYGDPLSRAHDLVREDVADGYVSKAEASRLYGYSPQGNG